ncbi:hypothetical protein ONZ45_g967 [Pleurotus djamor]|nr:hypothetical protein ONZ45_g967 [Pleurotus djamor]
MNIARVLRGCVGPSLPLRTYATTTRQFIPPSQLSDIQSTLHRGRSALEDEDEDPRTRSLNSPSSPSFYTARPAYYDQVAQIETAIKHARQSLKTLQLLPLPDFARASLPPLQPVWKDKDEMSSVFQSKMTTSRYRRVLALLNQLNDYHRIAKTAGCEQLAEGISHVVEFFERGNKDDVLARGKRKAVSLDDLGRSYSLGKRKTSAARVWMIPVRVDEASSSPGRPTQSKDSVEDILGIEPISPNPTNDDKIAVPTSTILINNIPLSEYFSSSTDRERIVRPLKIAGVLGAYNVFALVRGGGTTGQAGAVAHGISKGLVIHEPGLDTVLRRSKLLRRDPRMVERKKTGLAKARKRYTWVKR